MENAVGVVGEFNPFHRGHREHFEKCRALLGADAPIVCVMSGDFVQRGEPACLGKHARAEMAALCGADLVLELPLPWCMASAERFARGAVALLDSLGTVTHLAFGSESGDLDGVRALARAAADPGNMERIKKAMAGGVPFAAAREAVLRQTLGDWADLLRDPNDILAVEYCKALAAIGSAMEPVATVRAASRHDALRPDGPPSALALRSRLAAGEDVSSALPEKAAAVLAREVGAGRGPVTAAGLDQAVMARLRALAPEDFSALPDATEGLGNRLARAVRDGGCVDDVLAAVKTKRYPLSRLRRMVFAGALGLRANRDGGAPPYARVLASTERGRALLRTMGESARVPVITRPAAAKKLDGRAREIFDLTAAARDFYVLGYPAPGERAGGSDWRTGPVTLPRPAQGV